METVSLNLIEDIWNRLCDLDEKASAQLSKEFFKAQPALGIYCAAQNENLGKDGESSPMVELTIAIWQAMTQMAGRPIPMATPEEIEAAEEAITKRLEKLQEDSEMELQTHARGTIRNHNQREMLGFGVEILMQRYQEDPDLAPDSLGLEMLWLNTVVDCLDNLDPNVPRPQLEIPDLPDWPEPVPLGSEPAESDCKSPSRRNPSFPNLKLAATIRAPAAAAKNIRNAATANQCKFRSRLINMERSAAVSPRPAAARSTGRCSAYALRLVSATQPRSGICEIGSRPFAQGMLGPLAKFMSGRPFRLRDGCLPA